ncbi:MAG: hypothetical protein ACRD43_08950, partial [Pyrinomonadaceae bacterium]
MVTTNLPPPTRIVQAQPSPTPIVVGRPRVVVDDTDRDAEETTPAETFRPPVPATEFRTMSFG